MVSLQLNDYVANSNALYLTQGNLIVRLLNDADSEEVRGYQTLRHEWFVLRKGWVKPDPAHPGCETDGYDPYCCHLGVFDGSHLVAYMRALPWQEHPGLMLQHEFQDLVSPEASKGLAQRGNVEISRLIVAPKGSSRNESAQIAEILFKLLYCLGKRLEWKTYYIVLEEAWLRVLNRRFGIPFAALGEPHTYPDGTRTLAASASCQAMEEAMLARAPDKYQWYRESLGLDETAK
jgi:N-acyl-L-homoserine lactone synthetase